MESKEFKVLILGGGNCGLALASGLKKAGIDYTVFERDDEHTFYNGPRDWGMLLHWGDEYLKKVLPDFLVDRIKESRCNPHLEDATVAGKRVPFVDALSGLVLAEVPMEGVNRISRMKLRKFLTGDQTLNIQFQKLVQNVTVENESVTVHFQDGTVESGTAIVGCDGSRSKVREFLVGVEAAQLQSVGMTMINFPLSGYTAEEANLLQTLHPVFKIAAHPQRPGNAILAALDVQNPDEPTAWKFQNYIGWWGPPYASDLQDPTERKTYYRSFTKDFCEPFHTAAMKLRDEDTLPIYAGCQWSPDMAWDNHNGRVTIAGDAAHSMLPQRGQGLNNAMKDASDLVDAFKIAISGECTLQEAITGYEHEMKPRGSKEVALSYEQAVKARDQSTILDSPIFKLGWKRDASSHAVRTAETVEG
ncbi:putative monooxygenase, protein [Acrodontium crateriforme]|uniref:Monooxygenase, protein n=1 Tax=Acrodontium crateriforme TaxID=150365 RepID=A0AAQ3M3U2_9PEZI|nr:putative monooxygenase, protein [Acrodontium crateriforme]